MRAFQSPSRHPCWKAKLAAHRGVTRFDRPPRKTICSERLCLARLAKDSTDASPFVTDCFMGNRPAAGTHDTPVWRRLRSGQRQVVSAAFARGTLAQLLQTKAWTGSQTGAESPDLSKPAAGPLLSAGCVPDPFGNSCDCSDALQHFGRTRAHRARTRFQQTGSSLHDLSTNLAFHASDCLQEPLMQAKLGPTLPRRHCLRNMFFPQEIPDSAGLPPPHHRPCCVF